MALACDGIGPEIVSAALGALDAADRTFGLDLTVVREVAGLESLARHGTTLREEVLASARAGFDGILLGPQSHMDYPPPAEGGRNVSAAFRVGLDLYANIRPARSRPFLAGKAPGMDLVIMREATEGFYPDRNMHRGNGEMMPDADTALSIRKITRTASRRICRAAFERACSRRKKVTAVHKANSFHMSDGLFLECFRDVAKEFPDVATETELVDAMAALLVRQPEAYDVVVTTNLYGDILSDLASELSGSLGIAGSVNANPETGLCCAQAQHGSAPALAGQDAANPAAMILSAAMMLSWLGERRVDASLAAAGSAIEGAVDRVLAVPSGRTRDLGGTLGTAEFARRVCAELGGR